LLDQTTGRDISRADDRIGADHSDGKMLRTTIEEIE
jgi:hypothetical protein